MLSPFVERLRQRSVLSLTRIACWAALVGLAIMSLSIVWPRSLSVMLAMSAGHAIGGLAFLCYLLSVLLDITRPGARPSFVPAEKPVSGPVAATPEAKPDK